MRKITALFTLALAVLIGLWQKKTDLVKITEIPMARSRLIATTANPQPVVPNAPATKAAPVLDSRLVLVNELMRLHACYNSESCNFPKTDPRSYDIALGKTIAAKLSMFRKRFPRDPKNAQLARMFMRSYDGFVQEQALKMLSELPISSENLAAVTEGLNNTPDATLMKQAIPELQRYMGSTHEPQVHSFLGSALATGAHFTAETVSLNIAPFITNRSYSTYKNASDVLPEGAIAKRNLNSALREYRRTVTGA